VSTIPEHFIQQYKQTLELLSQEKGAKLPKASRMGSFEGSGGRPVAQIGSVEAKLKDVRHKPSPLTELPHTARWIEPVVYHDGTAADTDDLLRTGNNPESAYLETGRLAIARAMDNVWISNYYGDNKTGANGNGTLVPFDTGNTVAAGGTGMAIAKIRQGLKILEANNVDTVMEQIYCVVGPEEALDLRSEVQYISTDYRASNPIESARMPDILGVQFIPSTLLPFSTGTTRRCPLFARSGVMFGMWNSLIVRMGERSDLSYANYVYWEQMFGMTRLEEAKCAEILCVE